MQSVQLINIEMASLLHSVDSSLAQYSHLHRWRMRNVDWMNFNERFSHFIHSERKFGWRSNWERWNHIYSESVGFVNKIYEWPSPNGSSFCAPPESTNTKQQINSIQFESAWNLSDSNLAARPSREKTKNEKLIHKFAAVLRLCHPIRNHHRLPLLAWAKCAWPFQFSV